MERNFELVLGFYSVPGSAEVVLKNLRKQGFSHSALVHSSPSNKIWEKLQSFRVGHGLTEKFRPLLLPGETLLLVEADINHLQQVLALMRDVKNIEPATFIFLCVPEESDAHSKTFLPRRPLTQDGFIKHTYSIAKKLTVSDSPKKNYGEPILSRLLSSKTTFRKIYSNLQQAVKLDQSTTLSSEWLLDNTYVIQGQIEDIQRNLPKWFYEELPVITKGQLKGLPRVYALAVEIVASTDGRIEQETIKLFLDSYQRVTPLTIGELWALPLLIRLRLIECLENLALKVLQRQRDTQEADFWANRILYAVRRYPDKLYFFLSELSKAHPTPSSHFAERLIDHLSNEKEALIPVRAWLGHKMREEINNVIQLEQKQQMNEQVSLSNAITSLQRLSRLDWREVFESVSLVDRIFAQEASNTYLNMSFETRDAYRHQLEKLAKKTKIPEINLANNVVEMTKQAKTDLEKHIGYFLIDKGRPLVEKACGYQPTWTENLKRFFARRLPIGLFSLIFLITLGILWMIPYSLWILALIPASEIAVLMATYLFAKFGKPHALPKMSFSKSGVPDQYRTLIVVPILLTDVESIKKEIEKLEIRYLANPDPNFRFGLFSDFVDASEKSMPGDQELINVAMDGIKALNAKYHTEQFVLFHRSRKWNPLENCWMGWERKRGKIEELNRFLIGKSENEEDDLLLVGDPAMLQGIAFVITLDSDTQLMRNKARHLVEVLAHPLNRPVLNETKQKLERGYTIIQPRVSTSLVLDNPSWFTHIFSDPTGTDPYNWAVSDLYQDIFREGIYHGKGIYDLKMFAELLDHRFPENRILSHDLLEGAYVRTAFASDIELYDQFPSSYYAYAKRQHRWIRGDWQILDWLFPKVPGFKNKEANPLSLLDRWKIFDNLRRSLVYPFLVLFLIASWVMGSHAGTILSLVLFFIPAFLPPVWMELKKKLLRGLVNICLLPHLAYLNLDAILRALYRQFISHKHNLEWEVASTVKRQESFKEVSWLFLAALAVLAFLVWEPSTVFLWAVPFLVIWMVAPFVIHYLDKPRHKMVKRELNATEKQSLRLFARKTWHYFDDFVNPASNWLPPDNFQERLNSELAKRTSSTNIGLYLLTLLSARDLGYISSVDLIDRLQKTLSTLEKLELYEGHLLNWYNTETLQPLYPQYVSTVDSGNLIGALWTLQQGLEELVHHPLIDEQIFLGANDSLVLLNKTNPALEALKSCISQPVTKANVLKALALAKEARQNVQAGSEYWMQKIEDQLETWSKQIEQFLGWTDVLTNCPQDPKIERWAKQTLQSTFTLEQIKNQAIPGLKEIHEDPNLPAEWGKNLRSAVDLASLSASDFTRKIQETIERIRKLADGMHMQFLYNPERKHFSVGYNVSDRRLDGSYYDLLASEARLASFVAIAMGDVPTSHWWALGRPFGRCYGRTVLQSWGGTMFEYLMPILMMRCYDNTLLSKACRDAVACQIDYGKVRGIPWGISESAYSGLDFHKIYQYRAFGVPGLGLKRGLENDLVVTPYSAALALMIDPSRSATDMMALASKFHMEGFYGFYEAIDFTREQDAQGKRGVIIYAYMAHHMAMTLLAIHNTLFQQTVQRLFHKDPRVSASESLLYERVSIPHSRPEIHLKQMTIPKLLPFVPAETTEQINTPNTLLPHAQLFSNGSYAIMVSNSGTGYSKWDDMDITRWNANTTNDNLGSFIFIKDIERNVFWSSVYAPINSESLFFNVDFKADKAKFTRRDVGIETVTEIAVSPEDNVEIRSVTIANLSMRTRLLEITSYQELALAPHAADRAHPAFSKMFVETEELPDQGGLLAFRRPRSPTDQKFFAFHLVAMEKDDHELSFETSRERFIGLGGSLHNPLAMREPLSNKVGYVLDPIFSIRQKIALEPGKRITLSFITGIAATRKDTQALIQKYKEFSATSRAFEMAWTNAELKMRYMHVTYDSVRLFQQLASRVVYPHIHLRASMEFLWKNRLSQPSLWAHGISGDLPIVSITVGNPYEIDTLRETLTAHTYWRMQGLKCDLVILNEERSGYERDLQDQIKRLIDAQSQLTGTNKPGGIFLLAMDQLPHEDLVLILFVSRIVINASRGSLRKHINIPVPVTRLPPRLTYGKKYPEEPSAPLPFLELLYFNGTGGFTTDCKEYTIFQASKLFYHYPWCNVIANQNFGILLSTRGMECCWHRNSQTNRLTPWSNDPIVNPITDTIYLRNEDSGVFWTLTPSPIQELDPFRTRHGQGYVFYEHNSHAIEQQLLVFVPHDGKNHPPIRMQKLTLMNKSSHRMRLSVFSYTEWVLGTTKEETQPFVVTYWDAEAQALFAVNSFNPQFGSNVAFAACLPLPTSFTSDRTEFIGRNGTMASPSALKQQSLSGKTGPGLDPCAALQINVDLDHDEQIDALFILGQASSVEEARQLIYHYRDLYVLESSFNETRQWWDNFLTNIQIETPNKAANILFNRWLLYQSLSCRIWARTAFYQSSGAYGFRDQLQDVSAVMYADPQITRKHILLAASRQFKEGDVQHWWHPETGMGVRTRISDDLLWLPYVTALYITLTNDREILETQIPFLEGKLLEEGESEHLEVPTISNEIGTLLEHCLRAIDRSMPLGEHGVPLIGAGDWNDGFNLVGIEGKGESVWLGWFLIKVIKEILPYVPEEKAAVYKAHAETIAKNIEANCWDGEWYVRAYFDDGTPIGSKNNLEARIESMAQSWAVISEAGSPERIKMALDSVYNYLVREEEKIVLLFDPPFDKSAEDPGYIKGYPPGVRENGGQYTHGVLWYASALAKSGDGTRAVTILDMLNPIHHATNEKELDKYKVEPYAIAADVYSLTGDEGMGGWTWYTGAAGVTYRVWLEDVCGFNLKGDQLRINPSIPADWPGFKMHYKHHGTLYEIIVENPNQKMKGVSRVEVDGVEVPNQVIELTHRDSQKHVIKVIL